MCALIKEQTNRDVDKANVEIPEIKYVGEYDVKVKLHPEVTAGFKVRVLRVLV